MAVELSLLVARTRDLASLPEVVMRAVDIVNDPEASAADIAQVISEDAGLTARLLKIVNSPFYGFPSRIDTVSRAVTVIGILELLDLILATSVVKAFSGMPNKLINMDDFWEHSLYSGVVARVLAKQHRAPNPERYFVAGLLHDIGSLVLYRQLPEPCHTALQRARENGEILHQVELEMFGFDHADVGAALMRSWRFPESLIESTALHHRPMDAETYRLDSAIVHLADIIATAATDSTSDTARIPPFEPRAWELTGLNPNVLEDVLTESDRQFLEARTFLLPKAAAA